MEERLDFQKMLIITEYNKELCTMIMEHGRNGFSIETFCAKYNIPPSKIKKWYKEEEDFTDALDLAVSWQQLFWEEKLQEAIDESDKEGVKASQFMLDKIFKYQSFEGIKGLPKNEKTSQQRIPNSSDKDILNELMGNLNASDAKIGDAE